MSHHNLHLLRVPHLVGVLLLLHTLVQPGQRLLCILQQEYEFSFTHSFNEKLLTSCLLSVSFPQGPAIRAGLGERGLEAGGPGHSQRPHVIHSRVTQGHLQECLALSLLLARVAGRWPMPPPYQARRSHSSLGSSGGVCILQHTRPSRQSEALGEDTGDNHKQQQISGARVRGGGGSDIIRRETQVPGNP